MSLCTCCGRAVCMCPRADREQTSAEAGRPLNAEEMDMSIRNPDGSPEAIVLAKKNAHLPVPHKPTEIAPILDRDDDGGYPFDTLELGPT